MKKNKFKSKREEKSNSPFENRKKFCPFSQPGSPQIDYKDLIYLNGKIVYMRKILNGMFQILMKF